MTQENEAVTLADGTIEPQRKIEIFAITATETQMQLQKAQIHLRYGI